MQIFVAVAVAAALWSACASAPPRPAPPTRWPTDRWETAAPEEEGFDSNTLAIERSFDLESLMRRHRVPGLSVAVIDGFKLAWTKAYGVTEPGSSMPVTPSTLFLAGSISKPVTAVAALRLVQKGELSLDQDVNLRLRTWLG